MSSIESRSLRLGICFLLFFLLSVICVSSDPSVESSIETSRSPSQKLRSRRAPGAFVGMRGKKYLCPSLELCDLPSSASEDDRSIDSEAIALSVDPQLLSVDPRLLSEEPFNAIKRFEGFAAMRGKKDSSQNEFPPSTGDKFSDNMELFLETKRSRSKGFLGMRGKKKPFDSDQKRGPESKFFAAMRGKRPSVSRNRDASSAFFGVRGKRSDVTVKCDGVRDSRCNYKQEFVAARGSQ